MNTSIVAGGAGFLGSHLVDRLVERGEDVFIVDNLIAGRLANLDRAIASGRVTFIYADGSGHGETIDSTLAASGLKQLHTVYYFAPPENYGPEDPHSLQAVALARNGICAMALIDVALAHNAKFIFVSNAEVYTAVAPHPGGDCSEEARRLDEAAVAAAHRKRGLDARIVQFFNCYGPRMQNTDGRVLLPLLEAAMNRRPPPIAGDGKQSLALTYVDDAMRLLLLVAEEPQLVFEPIHAGSHDDRTVAEIGQLVAALAGVEFSPTSPARPSRDLSHRWVDSSYACSLGWQPKTSLEDGVRTTFDWFARTARNFV